MSPCSQLVKDRGWAELQVRDGGESAPGLAFDVLEDKLINSSVKEPPEREQPESVCHGKWTGTGCCEQLTCALDSATRSLL